jgi:ribA/ribD-fused uncharacterized protein
MAMFSDEYRFLSNFYKCDLVYKDIRFMTSEHAYQWEKAYTSTDKQKILDAKSPSQAKELGHKFKIDIKAWDEIKLDVMINIVIEKFRIPNLNKKLLETGNIKLIETNHWHDNYWGACYCKRCENKEKYNYLGKLLMKIRSTYRKKNQLINT